MVNRALAWLAVVLGLAFLLPNHYLPWRSFHQDLLGAIAFVPVVLIACNCRVSGSRLAFCFAVLSLIPLIQLAGGQIYFSGDAFISFLYILGFAVAVETGSVLVRRENGDSLRNILSPLFLCFVFSSFISVGISLHQWLGLGVSSVFIVDMRVGARPYGNLAQSNQLATLLLLGQLGVVFLYESRAIRGVAAALASSVIVLGLAMTQSRTIFLAIGAIWLGFWALRTKAQLKLPAIAVIFFPILFCLLAWGWPLLNELLLLPNGSTLGDRFGQNLRVALWASMIDAMGRSPWVGYGWNQIPLAQQAIALDHPPTYWFFTSAHNVFLDIALWAGLPIALIIAIGGVVWLWRQTRACEDYSSWCALLAVAVVLCHAMVEYPLSYAYFLLPIGFVVGALTAGNAGSRGHGGKYLTARRIRFAMATVAVGVLILTTLDYFKLEADWRNVRFEQARIGPKNVSTTPEVYLLTQLREDSKFARTEPVRDMKPDELEWMRKVSERFAWAASSFKYAQALALNGKLEAASGSLEKLCKIQPPKRCEAAIKEWQRVSTEEYPEFKKVKLPNSDKF